MLAEVGADPGFPFSFSAEAGCYLLGMAVLKVLSELIWEPDSF